MAGKRSKERKKHQKKNRTGSKPRRLQAAAPRLDDQGEPIQAEKPVSGGGTLGAFRSGMRKVAGTEKRKRSKADRLIDVAIWALAVGAVYMALKRFEVI